MSSALPSSTTIQAILSSGSVSALPSAIASAVHTAHSVTSTLASMIAASSHVAYTGSHGVEHVDPSNPTAVIAGHEQHGLFVSALVMLTLILIALNINRFLYSRNFHYLSETAIYILLGFVVAIGWTAMSYDSENKSIQLNSKFFYMVLLPPIIFEVHCSLTAAVDKYSHYGTNREDSIFRKSSFSKIFS